MKATEIIERIEAQRNEEQRQVLMRFFKTGKGDYGEGDEFLGLKVPQTRAIVKTVAANTSINEVPELLQSRWHEVRLCGLLILVDKFEKATTKRRCPNPNANLGCFFRFDRFSVPGKQRVRCYSFRLKEGICISAA